MVASQLREPRPASAEPHQPNRAHERAHRRPANRPQIATGRQPRLNLDSLAIGAPLTAALIGVLLTEGDAAFKGADSTSADGGSAARRGNDEAGAASQHGGGLAGLAPAAGGLAGQAGDSTGGEILDPVAAEGGAAPAAATGATAEGTLAPSGAAPAGIDGETVVSGGTSITLGTGGPLDDLGLGSVADGDGAHSNGRIGATIAGTAGDNSIHGTPYDDRLFGGAGNDTIYGYEGDDLLDGGAGDDQLFGGPGNDRLLGAAGQDQLFGGTGDDRLFGGSDNDRLFGEQGRDWLDGGSGNDLLDGGPGADRMTGGAGDDRLIVDDPNDVALDHERGPGGGGADTLVVGGAFAAGLAAVTGHEEATLSFSENLGLALPEGAARYTQQVASGIENVQLEGSADYDVFGDSRGNRITGNDGDNALFGGGGEDVLSGGAGSDLLDGGNGEDLLEGGSGNDILNGGASADELYGGDGDDILAGGPGADLLYGEAGDDSFAMGLNDGDVDWVFDQAGSNRLIIEGGTGDLVQTAVAGNDLYVVVHNKEVAVVDDYLGNENAFEGVDTGEGVRSIDDLMAPNASAGPALVGTPAGSSVDGSAGGDLLDPWLTRASLQGGSGADHLSGTSGSDWLTGHLGDDHLRGDGGRDVLEGGGGSDVLEGGAHDDRYLFKAGDAGWDVIRDTEGVNVAELDGFAGAKLKGVIVGQNLVVVANYAPLFTFEDFVGNEQAFAGIQMDDQFVATEDLLA